MNLNLIKFEFKQQFRQTIYWGIVVGSLFLMYISIYQLFKDSIHVFMTSIPNQMIQVLGLSDFDHFLGYYVFILQMLIIVLGIYSSMIGIKSMSLESHNHLSDFLFTKPIKKTTIFNSKIVQLIIQITLFWLIQTIIIMCGMFIFANETIKIQHFMHIQLSVLILCILIMMISILLYTLVKSNIKPIYQGIAIGLSLYIIKITSSLTQSQLISLLSIYDYFKWNLIANGKGIDWVTISMILTMMIIIYVIVINIYQRREHTS